MKFYSAAPTDDLRCGLLYLSHKYPNAPLVGIGFSLGANVLTRYLGEEGIRSRLVAGLALACVRIFPLIYVWLSYLQYYCFSLGTWKRTCRGALHCPNDHLPSDLPQHDRLDKDFISRNVYSKALGANLMALFKSHCESHYTLCCVYRSPR